MAIPYIGHLAARLGARFHVQLEVTPSTVLQTPALVPLNGRVVRVFRSDGTLSVGDQVCFSVHVARQGDDIWTGPSFMSYEAFVCANHVEAFLNGDPPECEAAADECIALDRATRRPRLKASRLAYIVELLR